MMVLVNPRRFVQRVGILAVAAVAITGFVSGQAAGASSASQVSTSQHYSVHQGDTLWSIAKAETPEQDPREYVASVVELNQLTTANVVPGQDLILPAH
jgi:nucleoid-associated protein YgaU